MKLNKTIQNVLLVKLGLKDKMICKETGPYIFDEQIFDSYMAKEYRNSSRKETDEVYRMREIILIHRLSGMRIEYVETDNYFINELEYNLGDIFIITLKGERLGIKDVDLLKQLFITDKREISFSAVKKNHDGD